MNTRASTTAHRPTMKARGTTGQKNILSEIRMSRLSHPRATLFAMILLAVVFGLFGLIASAFEPSYTPPPTSFEGAAKIIGDWLLHG